MQQFQTVFKVGLADVFEIKMMPVGKSFGQFIVKAVRAISVGVKAEKVFFTTYSDNASLDDSWHVTGHLIVPVNTIQDGKHRPENCENDP